MNLPVADTERYSFKNKATDEVNGVFVPFSMLVTLDFLFEHERYNGFIILQNKASINKDMMSLWVLGSIFYLLVSAKPLLGVNIPVLDLIADKTGCSLPTLALTATLYVIIIVLRRRSWF